MLIVIFSVCLLFFIVAIVMSSFDFPATNSCLRKQLEHIPTQRDVDMVVSWAGPDSPERARARAGYNIREQRYRDNGELRILLQSVDRFANHIIRFIYIILPDSAIAPHWLIDNVRVRLVRESEVLQHLPTFNSHAIETVLDKIPGLSQHFFYSCDDMLFTAPVLRENWFDGLGRHYIPRGDRIPNMFELNPGVHYKSWIKNHKLLTAMWPDHVTERPAHVMVMLSKDGFKRARELFADEFESTARSTLRSPENIHPVGLVLNIDLAEKRALLKNVPTFFYAVFDLFLANRVLRNFNIHRIKSAQLASVNDNGGSEKYSQWVHDNIYNCLL